MKLVAPLEIKVEYVYVLNDWFRKPEYKDVLNYVNSVGCHYKFNELPLAWLGLPIKQVFILKRLTLTKQMTSAFHLKIENSFLFE